MPNWYITNSTLLTRVNKKVMLSGKYWTAEEVYDRTAAPSGRGYSRHDRHLPNNTASPPNVMPTHWTCYNSPEQVSLQSISLMAFTCDIYILFESFPKANPSIPQIPLSLSRERFSSSVFFFFLFSEPDGYVCFDAMSVPPSFSSLTQMTSTRSTQLKSPCPSLLSSVAGRHSGAAL